MTKFIFGILVGALSVISFNTIYSSQSPAESKKDTLTVQFKDQVIEMDTTKMDSTK